MRQLFLGIAGAAAFASAVSAQDVTLAFPASAISDQQRQIVAGMFAQVQAMTPATGKIGAYGSIVLSPSFFELAAADPTSAAFAGLFQIVGNYDTAQEADSVAMEACNAARERGHKPCVVAARIQPK